MDLPLLSLGLSLSLRIRSTVQPCPPIPPSLSPLSFQIRSVVNSVVTFIHRLKTTKTKWVVLGKPRRTPDKNILVLPSTIHRIHPKGSKNGPERSKMVQKRTKWCKTRAPNQCSPSFARRERVQPTCILYRILQNTIL